MSISVLGGVPLPNSEASFGGGVGSLAMTALLLLPAQVPPGGAMTTMEPATVVVPEHVPADVRGTTL